MNFAALQHSLFLQALGSAILNSLWQGFIIWIIYETINVSCKNASSAFKNKLSTFLIFISFGWFLSSFIAGIFVDENLPAITLSPATIAIAESSKESVFNIQSIFSYTAGSLPYLSVSYIFLLAFLMFKLFSSYRYVYFIANKRLLSPPFELQHFASKVAMQLNITKKISVWISNHIDVPATVGFLKPVILIPVASINNLSSHQLEAIILHELSHIKRNDYITNLFISVIETILFFNPFILLLAKAIKRERENCCDDFVIQYRYDPHSYASALLRLEQSRRINLQLAIGAVSGKKQLLTRIKRITNNQVASKQFNYGQKLLALLLVTFIICSVAWLSPQEKNKKINKAIAKDLKTFTKHLLPLQTISTENINIINQPGEIKAGKENVHPDRKLPISPSNLLQEANPELNLINGKTDLDEVEMAAPDNPDKKEFYLYDANTDTPGLFFDQNVFNNIPLQLLENYSLHNMNIQVDINELNKNLNEAYKRINAMDWKKIQNDINESFSKLKTDQLSGQKMSEFYEENLKHLLEIRNEKKSNFKAFAPVLRKKIILIDSLRKLENTQAHRSMRKAETLEEIKDADSFIENGSNFYYVFEPVPFPKTDINVPQTNSCPKTISISAPKNKAAKIIIENLTRAYKESKNSFHFSTSGNTTNKKQKIITIEVNEIP